MLRIICILLVLLYSAVDSGSSYLPHIVYKCISSFQLSNALNYFDYKQKSSFNASVNSNDTSYNSKIPFLNKSKEKDNEEAQDNQDRDNYLEKNADSYSQDQDKTNFKSNDFSVDVTSDYEKVFIKDLYIDESIFSKEVQQVINAFRAEQSLYLDFKNNFDSKLNDLESHWGKEVSYREINEINIYYSISRMEGYIKDHRSYKDQYKHDLSNISKKKLSKTSKNDLYIQYRNLVSEKDYKSSAQFAILHEKIKTMRLFYETLNDREYFLKLAIKLSKKRIAADQKRLVFLKERKIYYKNIKINKIIKKLDQLKSSKDAILNIVSLKDLIDNVRAANILGNYLINAEEDADNKYYDMKNKLDLLINKTSSSVSYNLSHISIEDFESYVIDASAIKEESSDKVTELNRFIKSLSSKKYECKKNLDELSNLFTINFYIKDSNFKKTTYELLRKAYKKAIRGYSEQILNASLIINTHKNVVKKYFELKSVSDNYLAWKKNYNQLSLDWLRNLFNITFWSLLPTFFYETLNSVKLNKFSYYAITIFFVFVILLRDLTKRRYTVFLHSSKSPLQSYSFNIYDSFLKLFFSLLHSSFYPVLVYSFGYFLQFNQSRILHGTGLTLEYFSLVFFIFSIFLELSRKQGLFEKNFRINFALLRQLRKISYTMFFLSAPFILMYLFIITNSLFSLYDGLGRLLFIILNIFLIIFAKLIFSIATKNTKEFKIGTIFINLFFLLLFALPVFCLLSSAFGYYKSAMLVFYQFLESILLAFVFLLIFLFLNHWLFLKKRNILLNRRHQDSTNSHSSSKEDPAFAKEDVLRNEILQKQEDEIYSLNLQGAAKESLQLIKISLFLFFFFCLSYIWSSTQSAALSFLDGIRLFQLSSDLNDPSYVTVKSVLLFFFIAFVSTFLLRKIPGFLELFVLQKITLTPGSHYAIMSITRYLLIILGVFLAFDYLGVPWVNMQVLAATFTFALSFGSRDIIGNFFCGLLILFEKPIRIGDTITINNLTGTVSKISIRSTTVIDWDRKEIIIPNSSFITDNLINWSLSDSVTRVVVKVSAARDSDPVLVENLLYSSVAELKLILDNPAPEVWFSGFGSHSQDFEIRVFVKDMLHRWPVRHELHNRILTSFKENGVTIAYPEMSINI